MPVLISDCSVVLSTFTYTSFVIFFGPLWFEYQHSMGKVIRHRLPISVLDHGQSLPQRIVNNVLQLMQDRKVMEVSRITLTQVDVPALVPPERGATHRHSIERVDAQRGDQ